MVANGGRYLLLKNPTSEYRIREISKYRDKEILLGRVFARPQARCAQHGDSVDGGRTGVVDSRPTHRGRPWAQFDPSKLKEAS